MIFGGHSAVSSSQGVTRKNIHLRMGGKVGKLKSVLRAFIFIYYEGLEVRNNECPMSA